MRLRSTVLRVTRITALGLALVGIALLIVAWRCRTTTRLVWLRTGGHLGYVEVTPRHLGIAYWRRAEYDGTVRRKPLVHLRGLALLTTVEPTPPEPSTTAEKIADADRAWHGLGFAAVKGNRFWPPTPSQREAWIPLWFIELAAFTPLALLGVARRRTTAKST